MSILYNPWLGLKEVLQAKNGEKSDDAIFSLAKKSRKIMKNPKFFLDCSNLPGIDLGHPGTQENWVSGSWNDFHNNKNFPLEWEIT